MPVPVPHYTKQPAHPVIKSNHSTTDFSKPSVFQHLTHTLPLPPRGPPPPFATREEWINSLPDWRRNKPRRVWEDDFPSYLPSDVANQGFTEGLTVADNAMVIKGAPAQACIPPISALLANTSYGTHYPSATVYTTSSEDTDDGMSAATWHSDDGFTAFSDRYAEEMRVDPGHEPEVPSYLSSYPSAAYLSGPDVNGAQSRRAYDRGAFSPVYEEASPDLIPSHEQGSSPVGPATPFGEYVDRAVADAQTTLNFKGLHPAEQDSHYGFQGDYCGAHCYQCQHYVQPEQAVNQAAVPEPVVTPPANAEYKRLAEPLSEWVAQFVWKVCTTGMNLRPEYAQPSASVKMYASAPPSQIARSTHSLFLSTLLQPSAIFLALWYIVRLPVYFGPTCLGPEHTQQIRFRAELLGEPHMALDRDAIESYAPFRLIVLGCMLANKWLDDHTFSNKTWHNISNVPIRSLNKLESLALELFSHDLSVSTDDWSRWLAQVMFYHVSSSSPAFPQPISRPSASPHTIIRKSIETLMDASVHSANSPTVPPHPVFLGAEERREAMEQAMAYEGENVDVLEIDLDEDGPLREEYLPRRRVSAASSTRRPYSQERAEVGRVLPPPARWSPESDEPITRGQLRAQSHVAAPQPIAQMVVQPPSIPFHQALDAGRIWSMDRYPPRYHHYYMLGDSRCAVNLACPSNAFHYTNVSDVAFGHFAPPIQRSF